MTGGESKAIGQISCCFPFGIFIWLRGAIRQVVVALTVASQICFIVRKYFSTDV